MTKRANGEGSLRHRSDGRWEVRWYSFADGRLVRHSRYARTRQAASQLLRRAVVARDDGTPLPSGNDTIAEFMRSWLHDSASSVRPTTAQRYSEVIEGYIIPRIGRQKLRDLGPHHVAALYTDLLAYGLAPKSVQLAHTVLRRGLTQAHRWGKVTQNVAILVDPPRIPRREAATLTPTELAVLCEVLSGHRLEALFVVALLTGMRRGELLALRWDAVDFDRKCLSVRATMQRTHGGFISAEPKSATSRRTITLGNDAVAALRQHRAKQAEERLRAANVWDAAAEGLVFRTDAGRPLPPSTLVRAWNDVLGRSGLARLPFHALRHAATTLAVVANVAPKVTARRLGHATAALTLDRYSHVTDDLERRAADTIEATLRASAVSLHARMAEGS